MGLVVHTIQGIRITTHSPMDQHLAFGVHSITGLINLRSIEDSSKKSAALLTSRCFGEVFKSLALCSLWDYLEEAGRRMLGDDVFLLQNFHQLVGDLIFPVIMPQQGQTTY